MRELNERYLDDEFERSARAAEGRKRLLVQLAALTVALLFGLTLLGNSLKVFTFPTLVFLRESWELNRDPLVRELRQAVVRVEAAPPGSTGSAGANRQGTGFNLHPAGLVITNRHLVEGAAGVAVSFAGQGRHLAAAWHCSDTADLAVIILDAGDLPVVSLAAPYPPAPGETVTVIGNPLAFQRVSLRGQVRYQGPYRGFAHPVTEVIAQIHPGHSGSPVFNQAGQVVGIIFAAAKIGSGNDRLGLAVPVELIHELLAEHGINPVPD